MEPGQRLYMCFARGRSIRFLSHLDMMRLWERAIRRARLPLRYSQGFHPHPRISLASPLAVGMTADAEWLECEFTLPVSPDDVRRRLVDQLPQGITLRQVREAPWKAPALAARLRASVYELVVRDSSPWNEVQARVERFLQAPTWIVEEQHKERMRKVDLREVVSDVELEQRPAGRLVVRAVLRQESGRGARLETLLRALGLGPAVLGHRRRLVLDGLPDAEEGAERFNPGCQSSPMGLGSSVP